MENRHAARYLFALAALLEAHGANPYRVEAYRRAARALTLLPTPARDLLTPAGELDLPGLGERLRRKVGELIATGRMQFYDDLLADVPAPLRELMSIEGVGPKTAARLAGDPRIRTIRGVARAAARGRLRNLRGIGAVRERRLGDAARARLRRAA